MPKGREHERKQLFIFFAFCMSQNNSKSLIGKSASKEGILKSCHFDRHAFYLFFLMGLHMLGNASSSGLWVHVLLQSILDKSFLSTKILPNPSEGSFILGWAQNSQPESMLNDAATETDAPFLLRL